MEQAAEAAAAVRWFIADARVYSLDTRAMHEMNTPLCTVATALVQALSAPPAYGVPEGRPQGFLVSCRVVHFVLFDCGYQSLFP